jgi:glutathione S-transferase
MPAEQNKRYHEAAQLTSAVENVFRKLIRFLVGRISLVRLQEMIRYIYVEEAEKNLRAENPGKNVPMTRLALVTGLDTRTLVAVRRKLEGDAPQYRQKFLAELTPESAIVEAWSSRVNAGAHPDAAVLSYGSENGEFEQLVKATISGRGITTQSIIERLIATRSIERDKPGRTLKLVVDEFSPYLSDDEPSMVNAALSAVSNLISTIEHNMDAAPEDKFFQRQRWTFRLEPTERDAFRTAMRQLLERYKEEVEIQIEPWEIEAYGEDLVTAGIGLYYFEEK